MCQRAFVIGLCHRPVHAAGPASQAASSCSLGRCPCVSDAAHSTPPCVSCTLADGRRGRALARLHPLVPQGTAPARQPGPPPRVRGRARRHPECVTLTHAPRRVQPLSPLPPPPSPTTTQSFDLVHSPSSPVFILDPWFAGPARVGANRYRFLLESLQVRRAPLCGWKGPAGLKHHPLTSISHGTPCPPQDLDTSLRRHDSRLLVLRGKADVLLPELFARWGVHRLVRIHRRGEDGRRARLRRGGFLEETTTRVSFRLRPPPLDSA